MKTYKFKGIVPIDTVPLPIALRRYRGMLGGTGLVKSTTPDRNEIQRQARRGGEVATVNKNPDGSLTVVMDVLYDDREAIDVMKYTQKVLAKEYPQAKVTAKLRRRAPRSFVPEITLGFKSGGAKSSDPTTRSGKSSATLPQIKQAQQALRKLDRAGSVLFRPLKAGLSKGELDSGTLKALEKFYRDFQTVSKRHIDPISYAAGKDSDFDIDTSRAGGEIDRARDGLGAGLREYKNARDVRSRIKAMEKIENSLGAVVESAFHDMGDHFSEYYWLKRGGLI